MYGLVNKAIEEMVIMNHGLETWEHIKKDSKIDVDFFISNEPYDDAITYQLVAAASKELNLGAPEILFAFGEFWVTHTGMEKYDYLMKAGGADLKAFLVNLPSFHNRIFLMYPDLKPPEFKISDITDNSLNVHYYSDREGLQDFVRGLLSGLGMMYNQTAVITHTLIKGTGNDHDTFNVKW